MIIGFSRRSGHISRKFLEMPLNGIRSGSGKPQGSCAMMALLNRFLGFLGLFGRKLTKITFIGHEREGGYIYLNSPELRGFSFMLEPGENNLKTIIAAIDEPLRAYLAAKLAFRHATQRRPDLTGLRITQQHPINLVAELCKT
jgi:hypothetical protein